MMTSLAYRVVGVLRSNPLYLQSNNAWRNLRPISTSSLSSRTRRLLPIEALKDASAVDNVATEVNSEAASFESNPFFQLGVDDRLLPGVLSLGIKTPTEVQNASIPEVIAGRNVAIQCYTGSGKTLSYLLPVLSLAIQRAEEEWSLATRKTMAQLGVVQAVIVAPSRELAMQIVRVAESLLPPSAKKAVQQCIGGANMERQREALKMYRPIIVVGTPGRLAELSREGALQTHKCPILVLDEVDQLLAPAFREEMARLTQHTGRKLDNGRQTIVVSATLTQRVLQHAEPWCKDPVPCFVRSGTAATSSSSESDFEVISSSQEEQTENGQPSSFSSKENSSRLGDDIDDILQGGGNADETPAAEKAAAAKPSWGWGPPGGTYTEDRMSFGTGSAGGWGNTDTTPDMPPKLEHVYVSSQPQHKVDAVRRVIHALDAQRVLIFMNFQQRLKDTEVKLAARKMSVASLHGELTKQERQKVLTNFKAGAYRALVVSDVAARGLDIPGCDAVVNLELPTDASHYAHRAGRTGRAGNEGVVVSVVSGGQKFIVEKFGKQLNVLVTEVDISHGVLNIAEDGDDNDGGLNSTTASSSSRSSSNAPRQERKKPSSNGKRK